MNIDLSMANLRQSNCLPHHAACVKHAQYVIERRIARLLRRSKSRPSTSKSSCLAAEDGLLLMWGVHWTPSTPVVFGIVLNSVHADNLLFPLDWPRRSCSLGKSPRTETGRAKDDMQVNQAKHQVSKYWKGSLAAYWHMEFHSAYKCSFCMMQDTRIPFTQ